ncbi:MAG TPA: Mrp/NBP35 family ATP-binding protein [Bacteroidia bacterium]|nr:Mrp/NBP35 family ATP-binding protein [Bacteroidia bacterium]
MAITTEQVIEALRNVDDPDLKKDIVTLGMVKDVSIDGLNVSFTVVLTTPACPMKEMIQRACVNAIKYYVDKEANVNVKMTATTTTQRGGTVLPGVKNIIAVASGKGGVGKSTVAANLACALALCGAKVGLIDADIYGPSVPLMFDVLQEKPGLRESADGKKLLVPVESYGVKLLSIGFFADVNQAIAWRGPIAVRALNQMLGEADWGELDYLIVDLPPGTGDIHLSLVTAVPLTGVLIVSTPQNVALADARKGVAMFRMPQINVPVLGIIENMAWFTPAELPENKYYIFGREGALRLAEDLGIPLLGQIPLVQSICEAGDAGRPAVLQETTPVAKAFMELAGNVVRQVAITNSKPKEALQD